jgi:hypothetical protein
LVGDAQHEQGATAAAAREAPADSGCADLDITDVPGQHGKSVTSMGGDRDATLPRERWNLRAVLEPRLDGPAHRDVAVDSVDAADEFAVRRQAASRQRHRVRDANGSRRRPEGRLEDVGVRQIATIGFISVNRSEREAAAAFTIEERAEHTRRVEIGQT